MWKFIVIHNYANRKAMSSKYYSYVKDADKRKELGQVLEYWVDAILSIRSITHICVCVMITSCTSIEWFIASHVLVFYLRSTLNCVTSLRLVLLVNDIFVKVRTLLYDLRNQLCILPVVYNEGGYVDLVGRMAEECLQRAVMEVKGLPQYAADGGEVSKTLKHFHAIV